MHESIDYDEFGIGEITVWKKHFTICSKECCIGEITVWKKNILQSVPRNAVLVK
jgi:hypothetical protein